MLVESIAAGGGISFGALFANTWSIYKKHFFPIIGLTVICILPGFFFGLFNPDPVKEPGEALKELAVFFVIGMIFTTLSFLAVSVYIGAAVAGNPVSFTDAVNKACSRMPAGITTGLLTIVMLLGWFLLLFIPGLIKSVRYSFVMQAVALRGAGNMAAVRCSQRVVEDFWWVTVFASVMLSLPGLIVAVALELIAGPDGDGIVFSLALLSISIMETGFWHTGNTLLFLGLERIKNNAAVIDGVPN